jgi:formylglycine-generating enzyme required for sulfatase activity
MAGTSCAGTPVANKGTGGIEGTVTDLDSKPVAGMRVGIVSGTTSFPEMAPETNEEGYYQIGSVPPGTFEVAVHDREGNRIGLESVVVRSGETSTLNFTISTGEITEQEAVEEEITEHEEIENMVLIPAGNFLMGRDEDRGWSAMGVPEMFGDELPIHAVYVEAFYIDKYEVTNRQFKEFVDTTGYVTDAERHGSSETIVPADEAQIPFQGTDIGWISGEGVTWRTPEGQHSTIEELMDHPVVHVSWNDANAYAQWVGKRLPTEAEWEKAAGGGAMTTWFWSDELNIDDGVVSVAIDSAGKYANFYGEHRLDIVYPKEACDGYDRTAPVGSLQPNGYGLYDTAGNVFEWVSDWYQYDYFTNSQVNNPKGPESGDYLGGQVTKVIKGGGWYLCECYLRPANREPGEIERHDSGLGFRLALDAK